MAGEPKTGHLVHGPKNNMISTGEAWDPVENGKLLYYEPLPEVCYHMNNNQPTTPSCWHARGFRFLAYQPNAYSSYAAYFPNRIFTRESGQYLYILYNPASYNGTWYACALLLDSIGYWNCYMYVGPNVTLAKLKRATEVTSWQGPGFGNIYNTGGLPTTWEFFVIRTRSRTLYGPYSPTGVIAYHPYCRMEASDRWNGVKRSA